MSVQHITWAYQQERISTGAKFLLVTLANYADHRGVSWPGQERLAKDMNASTRSIRNWADELVGRELVEIGHRPGEGGGRRTNIYTLKTGQPETVSGWGQPEICAGQPEPVSSNTKENRQNLPMRAREKKWTPPDWINKRAWAEFEEHRRTVKKGTWTDLARKKAANILRDLTHSEQQQVIDYSIQGGYPGLFADQVKTRKKTPRANDVSKAYQEAFGKLPPPGWSTDDCWAAINKKRNNQPMWYDV